MYALGQVLLRLQANREILEMLPPCWERFCVEEGRSGDPITVNVRLTPDETARSLPDGWHLLPAQDETAYFQDGKKLFGLQQGASETEATVLLPAIQRTSVLCGIQYAMLMTLSRQCVGLHGVTLLCGNEIIVLSAPSGTGKTTLAGLLERYGDAIVLNGDFALLSISEHGVVFEPTPFCGSSGRCLNRRVPVHRIVFLEQASANRWEGLNGRQALASIMSNAFVPEWDPRAKEFIRGNILQLASSVRTNRYAFAPVKEAAIEFLIQTTVSGNET